MATKVGAGAGSSNESKMDGDLDLAAVKADLDTYRIRVSTLKERVTSSEGAYRGILETLSSGKWIVVPKGDGSTAGASWGPNARRSPVKLRPASGEASQPQGTNNSACRCVQNVFQTKCLLASHFSFGLKAPEEDFRRDEREREEREERDRSVERRLGESNDLQHEARQLISQSEQRMHRIGKVSSYVAQIFIKLAISASLLTPCSVLVNAMLSDR